MAVTAQIGDIKRLFSNVKTRGGWGETQVRAMLDDILPPGEYETNCKVRADSNDAVEFAVRMPMKGADRPLLPIDAKFPVEDYERLLAASEDGVVGACKACGAVHSRGAAFCWQCGQPLVAGAVAPTEAPVAPVAPAAPA